jgi:MoxR-like ATPase
VEQEGVYTLPEAQLDRFCMMLRVGYPSYADERRMLHHTSHELDEKPHLTPSDVTQIRALISSTIHIDERVRDYVVKLGRATRAPADVGLGHLTSLMVLGISPRSYQHVLALARVTAFMHGRDHVRPSDVKDIFPDAARHRIARSVRAEAEQMTTDMMIGQLLDAVPIP